MVKSECTDEIGLGRRNAISIGRVGLREVVHLVVHDDATRLGDKLGAAVRVHLSRSSRQSI